MILVKLIFLSVFFYPQSVVDNLDKTEFVAEHAVYEYDSSLVHLSSNVIINVFDNDSVVVKIKSEQAKIDISSSIIELSTFTAESSMVYINGFSGIYNFKKKNGIFYDTSSMYDRFVLKSKVTEVDNEAYVYKKSYITTCNLTPPHYHISSSRITLVPKKYFLSYNNIFYLGKIPIFYFPVFYKPLGEGTPIISQFYPGFDERNGFYIKSNYTYRLSHYLKIRSYLDYYSKKGFGIGGEFFGYNPDDFKFNISYYRINEYGNGPIYWGINGGVWYRIYSSTNTLLYFQSFLRLPSDPDFNDIYFRSNPFVISNSRQWDASFTYMFSSSYMRLKTSTIYGVSNNSFVKHEEIYPKFEYQMLTRKISFMPLSHSFYFSVENKRLDEKYFQKNSNVKYTLYNSLNILRQLSWYNSLDFNYDTFFSTSPYTTNISIMRYSLNSSFRYSFMLGNVDIGYSGIFRSDINKLSIDKKSQDDGIEKSEMYSKIYLISSISEYMGLQVEYDLKKYQNLVSEYKRVGPISFEYYKFFSKNEIYLKEVYSLSSGHKAFVSDFITSLERNYLKLGFANYDTEKERFFVSTVIGFMPLSKKGWHGELTFRYYFDFSRDMGFKFYERSFIVHKEFHDFNTKFVLRERKGRGEFFFYITMKMNDPYRKDRIDSEIDREFRPWRKFDEERDY